MEVQYLLIFFASQLSLIAVLTPWGLLREQVQISDECTLPKNYQFRQWGGACGHSWEELKDMQLNSYFAMLHTLTKIRIFSLICVILLTLCHAGYKKHKHQIVTVLNIVVFILSMMATTMYFTEQNTTMVIPIRLLHLQGPGFWAQVLTASCSLSYVFIEFYITYSNK